MKSIGYNPLNVEIPNELKTKKSRFFYWILWHLHLMDLGRGQVVGKFTQLLPELGAFILILDKVGIVNMSIYQMILIFMLGMFTVWFLGWVYQKINLDQINNLISTYRNPIVVRMHNKINNKKCKGDKDGF